MSRRNLPTIHNLMSDPLYRQYMKRMPARHQANATGNPWQLWVDRGEGRWGTAFKPTYPDAWTAFLHHYRADDGRDVTLVSRRLFYAPPGEWYRVKIRRNPTANDPSPWKLEWRWRQLFWWDEIDLAWCGRCRRPTYWMPLFENHHALRRMPAISPEDNQRCTICGIRWIATPSIAQMIKIEVKPK